MSRRVLYEVDVKFDLEAKSPLHVGGGPSGLLVDLQVATNGLGNAFVPGTGLAGAIREWSSFLRPDCDDDPRARFFDHLWGWIPERVDGTAAPETGYASNLFVDDAELTLDGNPLRPHRLPIRYNIGINRFTETVGDRLLFSRQVVPIGTKIPVRISAEVCETGEKDLVLDFLAGMIEGFQRHELFLGAASSRGLGRVGFVEESAYWRTCDFTSRAGVVQGLRDRRADNWISGLPSKSPMRSSKRRLTIEVDWAPISPIMSSASVSGLVTDTLPETEQIGDHVFLVLPGSGIRGALRSEAERIVRTVTGLSTGPDDPLHVANNVALVDTLFGAAAEKDTDNGAGAVRIGDCFSTNSVPVETWRRFELSTDKDELGKDLAALREAGFPADVAFHVTLSRFAGGASDSLLFTAFEPREFSWEPIRIDIDLDRPGLDPAAITLLLISLNRIRHGQVQLGYGGNRGYGDAEITGVRIAGTNVADDPLYGPLVTESPVCLSTFGDRELGIQQAWEDFINQQPQMVPA